MLATFGLALALVAVYIAHGPFAPEASDATDALVSAAMMRLLLVLVPAWQGIRPLALLAANAEGIEYWRELGRHIMVPWSEMRLVVETR